MTRKPFSALVLLAAALVVLAAPFAGALEGEFQRAEWTDPAPSTTRDGTPLAYLEEPTALTGVVVHPRGIRSVNAVLVPDPDNPPADGCDATVEPDAIMDSDGSTFHVNATFPCNLVYELRANAQSNPGSGLTPQPSESQPMPLLVAVAIPPAPVSQVDAVLEVNGDDRTVTLEWPAGSEPDLLGYIVTRVTGGNLEPLGRVGAGGSTRFVDEDPPEGKTSRYEVTSVRSGPDDDVQQVLATPATVAVEVPGGDDTAAADGGGGDPEPVDPEIAGEARPAQDQGQANAGGLSSVRIRGGGAPPSGPPTTLDTGFSETIDYPEPGEVALTSPGGDPAVVAEFDEGDPLDDKQRLAFIAGGLAVLVGAAMIFTVTRRAARDAY